MSTLLLKGSPIGKIKGILLDKDGTLSNSENHLITLGSLRLSQAINLFESNKRENNKATFKLNPNPFAPIKAAIVVIARHCIIT